jgi:hypothetical protein
MAGVTDDHAADRAASWSARLRAWSYWPALSHPVLRRLLPGYALSALGDGMSAVAIAWLALRLVPGPGRGLWVGAAVAAYTVPGVLGAVTLGRWLRHRSGVRLVAADAVLRAAALGAIPLLSAARALHPVTYVCLLGASSLLSAWGSAGQYTLMAQILPARHRVAGNALLSSMSELTLVIGPGLAGVLTVIAGPAVVIGVDALTWAVLAISYWRAAPMAARASADGASVGGDRASIGGDRASVGGDGGSEPASAGAAPMAASGASGPAAAPAGEGPAIGVPGAAGTSGAAGSSGAVGSSAWRVIGANQTLLGLIGLSFAFFLLYGPVEVALPVHIAGDLHASAALLGTFWAVFGIGSVLGSLAAPYLRRWPLWPTMIGIVAGWGLSLLPLGLGAPIGLSLAAFAAGGLIYAPYNSLAMAVFQDATPAAGLAAVLAARASVMIAAAPIGTALGGPLVAALGAQGTLLASALTTIVLAMLALAAAPRARARAARSAHPSS